jgi:hypothetical protein
MNFADKVIFCYEYLFYKQYTCFGCGVDFRMKRMKEDEDFDFSPACSYSCLMAYLPNKEKQIEIDKFKNKYGNEWKIEYTKYLKNYINHYSNSGIKKEMIKNGEIDEYGNKIKLR